MSCIQVFNVTLEETRTHVTRLSRVFSAIAMQPDTKSNNILDEMTGAANDSISDIEDSFLPDTALVLNSNFVEH